MIVKEELKNDLKVEAEPAVKDDAGKHSKAVEAMAAARAANKIKKDEQILKEKRDLNEKKRLERLAKKKEARKRQPKLGGLKLRMAVEPKPGFHLCWVSDRQGSLERKINQGYDFVAKDGGVIIHEDVGLGNIDTGNCVSVVVNDHGEKNLLMQIENELYQEDQKYEQDLVDQKEDGLRIGADKDGKISETKYIPKEGISIKQGEISL